MSSVCDGAEHRAAVRIVWEGSEHIITAPGSPGPACRILALACRPGCLQSPQSQSPTGMSSGLPGVRHQWPLSASCESFSFKGIRLWAEIGFFFFPPEQNQKGLNGWTAEEQSLFSSPLLHEGLSVTLEKRR